MLQGMYIKNFALLKEASLDLESGLSVLIGESGSGKSLVLDALSALMGGRCSVSNIREGEERYSLQASFRISDNSDVLEWLKEKGFPHESEEVSIVRELSREGKSRVFIQESLASLSLLKKLGSHLCEVHNQNEQMFLLDKGNQLDFIDRFARIGSIREEMQSAFSLYRNLKKRLEEGEEREKTRKSRKESLQYQMEEWERISPKPNELEELVEEEKLLSHGEKLFDNFRSLSYHLHEGDNSVLQSFGSILSASEKISEIHSGFGNLHKELEMVYEQLKEVKSSIREEEEEVFFSPDRLDGVQSRIRELTHLQKKYNKPLAKLQEECEAWKKEYEELEDFRESMESMKQEFLDSLERIKTLAVDISKKRRNSILSFEDEIQKELSALGMKGARIQIVLRWEESPQGDVVEGEKSYILGSYGLDQAEYYFSANPGEKPRPLRKIASGGEMSRIMLAIRSVLGRTYSSSKLLVFDEIDSGVGGESAVSMADRLKSLGEHSQILLITHSQSIAAVASNHWKVEKKEENGRTFSILRSIPVEEKPWELARMVAGNDVTDSALNHAKEILFKKAV